MKKLLPALLIGAVVSAALVFFLRQPPAAVDASLRHPGAGDVIGFAEKYATYAWLGIPYAQPPLGELRWRAPRPLSPWDGTRRALAYGAACPQLALFGGEGRVDGAEDCLTLNIWSPRLTSTELAGARLPVLVWIHGGGNTMGSARMNAGYQLAGTQRVIVVSINYRLGLFGWFSHPALRDGSSAEDASGNYGLLDQIAALRWVRNNIAAFGGNPDNVTVFGESAGARDVFALLAAKPAQGLFQRAIAQSGSLRTVPLAQAENYRDDAEPGLDSSSREFVNRLLVAQGAAPDRAAAKTLQQHMPDAELLAWLRGKSPEQLLAVVKRRGFAMYETPTNLRDGAVLPADSLFSVFADPNRYHQVPLIIGSNRDESKLFMGSDPSLVEKRWGFLPRIKDLSTYNRINGYFSDTWKALGVDEPAAVFARAGNDHVFVYRFDWDEAPDYGLINLHDWLGAAHGLDVPFVLGEGAMSFPFLTSRDNAAGRALLSSQMMAYWAQFARTGAPGDGGNGGRPQWQARGPEQPRQLILATDKGGGLRLDNGEIKARQIKWRLLDDSQLSLAQRCALYVQLFLINFHSEDFWSASEYHALGCAGYPPDQVPPAS